MQPQLEATGDNRAATSVHRACRDSARRWRRHRLRQGALALLEPEFAFCILHAAEVKVKVKVNGTTLIRIVWVKVRHIFLKLLETLRNLVHLPSWSSWRRFRLYFARESPLWRR